MKKLLAIILSIAMLFSVLAINTFAADEVETETATVEIITNTGSAVKEDTEIYFAVKFNNFSEIKGMDVVITGTNIDFEHDNHDVLYNGETLKKGTDYKAENNTIHVVCLTNGATGILAIKAIAGADNASLSLSGTYAKNGEELFENVDSTKAVGTIVVAQKVDYTTITETQTITAPSGKFIPNGAVLDKNGKFIYKNAQGVFAVEKDAQYASYDIPQNGITTFGASDSLEDPAIKFGSYSELNTATAKHGTMVFEGEYVYFKNYYIKKGWTVEKFVKAFYDAYDNAKTDNADYIYFIITDKNGIEHQLNVYKFDQKNHMFKNGKVLEYTIRLSAPKDQKLSGTYAAVAYSIDEARGDENKIILSQEVKSVTKSAESAE